MYKHFLLNIGYVEEAMMAQVLLTTWDSGFGSLTDAAKAFVDDLASDKGFDNTDPDQVYDAILEFMNGDMQTHGYFLHSCNWNVCNFTDIEPDEVVICIDRAPSVIRDVYFGNADQHTLDCFVSCIEITATVSDHKVKL